MTSSIANPDNTPKARQGFDAPAVGRDGDHLNRWPLAREIYGIATTGPKDWSVRIGIYGEWGTGKTSVLKFVTQFAEKHGHIVVWFDPWEHSTKAELWRAFVSKVFEELKAKIGKVPGANAVKAKEWAEKAGGIIGSITGLINEEAGKAVDGGLHLVKKHFAAGSADFKAIQPILGEKRVIVLIDDLDRTAPELVPEILFALKELMDIPGFSFICAFDPVVVGEVLGKFHPGFGDGLKFLDKIIDYPRWLAKPSVEALVRMAVADAARSCPYVPSEALAHCVSLLPPNPRAVRQFIRLLSLLKPQIDRHHPNELNWPAIIAASVLKVRHPRIAHELLNDSSFWSSVAIMNMSFHGDNAKDPTAKAVNDHITNVCAKTDYSLDASERREVAQALTALCSQVGLFSGLNEESASYQFNLGEAPAAVTWKEFDAFILVWGQKPTPETLETWLEQHIAAVERDEQDAYLEVLQAATQRYAELLQKADNTFTEDEKTPLVKHAESLLALLNALIFQNGNLSDRTKWIGEPQVELIVEKFTRMAAASQPVHVQFWPENERFIVKFFELWRGDVAPLIKVLQPYTHLGSLRNFDTAAGRKLHKKLCAAVLPHFAQQTIASFRQNGFIERLIARENETYDVRCLILDPKGPLWTTSRQQVLDLFNEASTNRVVQANAHQFLHWLILAREGHAPDPTLIINLFSDQSIFDLVWNAVTASQLGPRAVSQLRKLPDTATHLKINCQLPTWWAPVVATFTVPASPQEPDEHEPTDGESPQNSTPPPS